MIKWTGGTKKCLDVSGGADNAGTNVQIYSCDSNNNNQKFTNGVYVLAPHIKACIRTFVKSYAYIQYHDEEILATQHKSRPQVTGGVSELDQS